MVASDAPSVRAEVVATVDGPDTEIVEVRNGPEVVDAVARHQPDLLVVDLQMGSMGGMAVCLELRLEESYGKLDHVPVLMLLDRRADVFLARRSQAEGWIVKPLDPIRIRKAVTTILDGGEFHDASYMPMPVLVEDPSAGAGALPADAGALPAGAEALSDAPT